MMMNTPYHGVASDPTQRTQQPIVTGASVIAIKYKDGVMMACDTQASYGSLARYKNIERMKVVGTDTLLGASGEISDFQAIDDMLRELTLSDLNQDDGYKRSPTEIYNYLRAVLYQRRGKGNPLWNQLLIAGCRDGNPFLGYVDLIGTSYEENFIATGFGGYLAIPLIREKWRPDLSEDEAKTLLEECLRVLFYRDCKASNKVQIGKITATEASISEPYEIAHHWNIATYDARHAVRADGSSW